MSTPASEPTSPISRRLALLVAGAFFMEILDGTVIAPAAPHIAADLGVAAVDINLAISAYVLTLAVLIPISGWLADRFGARTVFTAAIAIFTVASAGCALATSLPVLVATRVLQGVGGALMVPVGRLVVLRTTAKSDLIRAIAYLTWPALARPRRRAGAGWPAQHIRLLAVDLPDQRAARDRRPGAGPPAGARTCVPPGAAAARRLAGFRADRDRHRRAGARAGEHRNRANALGRRAGRRSRSPARALAAAVVHLLRAPLPLLDLRVLRIATFRSTVAAGLVHRAVISAVPFLLPLLFQLGFGWTAAQAGLVVIALFVGNVASNR